MGLGSSMPFLHNRAEIGLLMGATRGLTHMLPILQPCGYGCVTASGFGPSSTMAQCLGDCTACLVCPSLRRFGSSGKVRHSAVYASNG